MQFFSPLRALERSSEAGPLRAPHGHSQTHSDISGLSLLPSWKKNVTHGNTDHTTNKYLLKIYYVLDSSRCLEYSSDKIKKNSALKKPTFCGKAR